MQEGVPWPWGDLRLPIRTQFSLLRITTPTPTRGTPIALSAALSAVFAVFAFADMSTSRLSVELPLFEVKRTLKIQAQFRAQVQCRCHDPVTFPTMIICLACCRTLSPSESPSFNSKTEKLSLQVLTTPCCQSTICNSCLEVTDASLQTKQEE